MASFREVFTNTHVILPVIHIETELQAIENATITEREGCDGVFLIDMRGYGHQRLFEIYDAVHSKLPDFWIGLNCLDLRPAFAFSQIPKSANGYWADNAGICEGCARHPEAAAIQEARSRSEWNGLYFGGVAFKYQSPVRNVAAVARIATEYMDVVTTSGVETGKAADPEKIRRMKEAIGDHPLAIASGISSENVDIYLKSSDCLIVSTSLLIPNSEDFDPAKVGKLVSKVRSFRF